ncbi:MAG: DUF929 family protein [Actinomycetota bacterium]|nr:DUF929 family protein [Actinomycetota bacterium]
MNQPKRPAAPSGKPDSAKAKGKGGNGAGAAKSQVPPRGNKGRPRSPGARPKPSATRPGTPGSGAPGSGTPGSGTPGSGTPGSGPREQAPMPSKSGTSSAGGGQGAAWERRRQQRQRRNLATLASVAVVAVVVALVVIKVVSGNGSSKSTAAPGAVVSQVTAVPVSALVAAAGSAGSGAISPPISYQGPPVPPGAKPSILYVGADYCPYCAAERWPMVMALAQFGSFSGLGATTSSSSDANPNTPTFSFHGASYTSPFLNFTGVEQQNRTGGTLDKLTPAQTALVQKYDAAPYVSAQSAGTIPFVMFGSKFLVSGASYDSSALANLSMTRAAQILSGTADASAASTSKLAAVSINAKAAAAHIVGAICSLTNNQPAKVCGQVPDNLKTGGGGSSGKGSK